MFVHHHFFLGSQVRELAQKVLALINDPHTLEAAKVRTSMYDL